jgi:hypothetical protein
VASAAREHQTHAIDLARERLDPDVAAPTRRTFG